MHYFRRICNIRCKFKHVTSKSFKSFLLLLTCVYGCVGVFTACKANTSKNSELSDVRIKPTQSSLGTMDGVEWELEFTGPFEEDFRQEREAYNRTGDSAEESVHIGEFYDSHKSDSVGFFTLKSNAAFRPQNKKHPNGDWSARINPFIITTRYHFDRIRKDDAEHFGRPRNMHWPISTRVKKLILEKAEWDFLVSASKYIEESLKNSTDLKKALAGSDLTAKEQEKVFKIAKLDSIQSKELDLAKIVNWKTLDLKQGYQAMPLLRQLAYVLNIVTSDNLYQDTIHIICTQYQFKDFTSPTQNPEDVFTLHCEDL